MPDERKTLALIAHDGKKTYMVVFVQQHKHILEKYELVATSITGQIL